MKIAVALFPGVEELDWAGPYEVLALWGRVWPADDVHVFTIAESPEPITCANGARVLPTRTWEDAPQIDVLVYPGGRGAVAQLGDERIRNRLRDLSARGTLMTSVCTGALVYADAGLLEGRAATTHWSALDDLAGFAGVEVRTADRFVDAGTVVTSSGVSAGIDMALHLVARLHSLERAQQIRRQIQYDPEPPV